jgi:hypothetical protein
MLRPTPPTALPTMTLPTTMTHTAATATHRALPTTGLDTISILAMPTKTAAATILPTTMGLETLMVHPTPPVATAFPTTTIPDRLATKVISSALR